MSLEQDFLQEMKSIYLRAIDECNYKSTRFMQLLNEIGAVKAAELLVSNPKFSAGISKLWELGRLDLSVEALVLNKKFQPLFSSSMLEKARLKLINLGYIIRQ